MRSLRFTEFGPPSVLRIEEGPIPEPCDGQALIQVKAAAINPSDIADVSGHFKNTTLPRTPGRDFAGVVVTGERPQGEESVINTNTQDLLERVLELTRGRGVDAVFDSVGGALFEPALRSLRFGGQQVAISSRGDSRVSFNLVDFYHNFSRLLGVDSYGLTSRQIAEIADKLGSGWK